MGTLIDADLFNLDKAPGLGAPVISIGGAGAFDGIFVTGVLAVLIAGFADRPRWRGVTAPTRDRVYFNGSALCRDSFADHGGMAKPLAEGCNESRGHLLPCHHRHLSRQRKWIRFGRTTAGAG